MSSKVKILSEENLHQGYVRVKRYGLQFQLFQGGWSEIITREVCLRGDAVVIVPYDPALDQVLMIEQFRLPAFCSGADPWLVELPAGMVDKDETLEQVAAREMIEETGLAITHLRPIHHFMPSPGVMSETLHLFAGKIDLAPLKNGHGEIFGQADEAEDIRLRPIAARDIAGLLDSNKINNASAIIGLYWLLRHKTLLQKEWISS